MHDHDSSSNAPRPPREPEGDDAGGAYPPPPPPAAPRARPRTGVFTLLSKFMGVVAVALFFIAVGYYGAMAIVFSDAGNGVSTRVYQPGDKQKIIAVVPIEGMIDGEKAEFVRRAMRSIERDDRVVAVVLRVDSPGGGTGPSEKIYHLISRFREESGKPVVASYGAMAASGGVYISAQADYIYAQPTCVTGSIGVFAPIFTYEGLIEKIGVEERWMEASGSPAKTRGSNVFRAWDERDMAVWQKMLDASYERFHDIVAAGRGDVMSEADLAQATTGAVFLAEQAVELHLVDEIGYLDDAIADARARAAVAVQPLVLEYGPPKTLLQQLGVQAPARSGVSVQLNELSGDQVRRILLELGTPRMMYLYRP